MVACLVLLGSEFLGVLLPGVAEAQPGAGDARLVDLNLLNLRGDQRSLSGIRSWNSLVLIEVEDWNKDSKRLERSLLVVDVQRGRVEPLALPGCELVRAVAGTADESLALCERGGGLRILSRRDDHAEWASQDLPVELKSEGDARIVASPSALVVVTPGQIFWSDRISKGKVSTFRPPIQAPPATPSALALVREELLLGYDHGEFGGLLLKVVQLAGPSGPRLHSTVLKEMNVRAILVGAAGEVWVGDGLTHFSLREAGLHLLEGRELKTVFRSPSAQKHSAAQPGVADEVALLALSLNKSGEPIVALFPSGVFRLRQGALEPLVLGELLHSHRTESYTINSRPNGVLLDEEGSLLVAMRASGVLVIPTGAQPGPVRQILVPKPGAVVATPSP